MRAIPDKITTVALASGTVSVDGHGYLIDPEHWTPDFATHVAHQENLELNENHQKIIEFMRAFQTEHGVAADARFVLKYLAKRDGLTKLEAKRALFELFPYGYVKQACKIAGMKQPRAWSTG